MPARTIYYPMAGPPSAGGQHVNVAHVRALAEAGFDAKLLYIPSGAQAQEFEVDAPLVRISDGMRFSDQDIVVLPEPWRGPIEAFGRTPAQKLIHCQNPFYLFHGFDDIGAIAAQGYRQMLTCSEYTSKMVRQYGYAGDIFTVRPAISPEFSPGTQEAALQIAYMPRKRAVETVFLQGLFKSLYPQFASIPWVKIDGMSRAQCADLLRGSAVFASFSWFEGLGLPPLEAMACGSIVVGLHGFGGLDYATPENGYWSDEGDYFGFASQLASVLADIQGGTHEVVRQAGFETAARYSEDAFRRALLAAWGAILEA